VDMLKVIFKELSGELENDEEFKSLAEWSTGKWVFEIANERYTIHMHKGRIIEIEEGENSTGSDFTLTGAKEEWDKLLKGEIKLPQGLNYYHGRLFLRGNFVEAANNMRSLSYIIRKMQELALKHGGDSHERSD
jgi:putative sterol carrier protein